MARNDLEGLGGATRDLIAAARGAHEPNELNRARVRRGVEVKLAAGLGLALGPTASALAGATKITLVVATVGTVVGAGAYKAGLLPLPKHAAPIVSHARPATRVAVALPPAPPVEAPAPAPAVEKPAPVHHHARPAPAAPVVSASALAEETSLIGAANTALAHHDVASALALLNDYDHRPGAGVLAEERTVTGILTLCAAGRTDAARAEARHFRARWPRSPLTARVDGSCVGAGRPASPTPSPAPFH
jgi:hypothetical protein